MDMLALKIGESRGGGGGDITLVELQADENKVYTPDTGKAYKKVTVSVPVPASQEQLDSIAEGIGVATPSTPASIESAVDGLIADANEATGESDTNLTDAVGSLIAGQHEQVYYNAYNVGYTRHTVATGTTVALLNGQFKGAQYMESIEMPNFVQSGAGGIGGLFLGCTNLKRVFLPKVTGLKRTMFENCTALEQVQIGSIGYPVTDTSSFPAFSDNHAEIIMYVDAATLADIPEDVIGNAPWGATHATIIYRNSTTGEVIEA